MLFTGSILAAALQGSWRTMDWARDKASFSGQQARVEISCRCCWEVPVALWGLVGQASGKDRDSRCPPPSICLSPSHRDKPVSPKNLFVFPLQWEHACANPHTHEPSHSQMCPPAYVRSRKYLELCRWIAYKARQSCHSLPHLPPSPQDGTAHLWPWGDGESRKY